MNKQKGKTKEEKGLPVDAHAPDHGHGHRRTAIRKSKQKENGETRREPFLGYNVLVMVLMVVVGENGVAPKESDTISPF